MKPDLIVAMELRDAYFLWQTAKAPHSKDLHPSNSHANTVVACLYYAALIFFQDEAFSDFAASVYLRQFQEFQAAPHTAMVAQSPYIAAHLQYHVNSTVPFVPPLALYVDAAYAPNSTRTSLLVICARQGFWKTSSEFFSRTLYLKDTAPDVSCVPWTLS